MTDDNGCLFQLLLTWTLVRVFFGLNSLKTENKIGVKFILNSINNQFDIKGVMTGIGDMAKIINSIFILL